MAVRPAKNARVVWPDRALTFRLPFPLLHISSLTFSQHSIPFYTLQSIQQIIPCTTQRSSNASSLVTLVGTRAQKSKKNCPLLTCMLCAVCVKPFTVSFHECARAFFFCVRCLSFSPLPHYFPLFFSPTIPTLDSPFFIHNIHDRKEHNRYKKHFCSQ